MNVYAHPLASAIWIAAIGFQATTVYLAVFRQHRKPQHFFGVLVGFFVLYNSAAFVASALGAGWAYYHICWWGFMVGTVGIGIQAFNCYAEMFSPASSMPRKFHFQFWSALVVITTAIAIGGQLVPTEFKSTDSIWYTASRNVNLWLCGYFWAISALSDYWHLKWHTRAYGIAKGFVILLTSNAAISVLYSRLPPTQVPRLYVLQVGAELCAALVWWRYFGRSEAPVWEVNDADIERLRYELCVSASDTPYLAIDEGLIEANTQGRNKSEGTYTRCN